MKAKRRIELEPRDSPEVRSLRRALAPARRAHAVALAPFKVTAAERKAAKRFAARAWRLAVRYGCIYDYQRLAWFVLTSAARNNRKQKGGAK